MRPIVQTHSQIILLKGFKSHDQRAFKSMANYLLRVQFLLEILKAQLSLAILKNPILISNIEWSNFHWQY